MENIKILAINPGSTSTKVAVYENNKSVFTETIRHSAEELAPFDNIISQFEFRKNTILKELESANIDIETLSAVVGRGGLIKPVEGGVYEVNDALKKDLEIGVSGQHASNLGGLIALDLANTIKKDIKAYIADPVVVDELEDIARFSGHPKFERRSIFHALNHKAIAYQHAKNRDNKYENLNLIIAHLGGGITVGAHKKGRVIDVNNGLDGEGAFSPERSGTLPVGDLIDLCYSGDYTQAEVRKMIVGQGGFMAYFGTNSAYDIEKLADKGDEKAILIQDAMGYQIAKAIGEMAAVLKGEVDGILITGGVAYNAYLMDYIRQMVGFIAPVFVYPGEDEMLALAQNAYLVVTGEKEVKVYS